MNVFADINHPRLILDEQKCRANIRAMAEKADRHGVTLRPHFKTHQSGMVGEWFRQAGVTRITVSSAGMAQYFADAGWEDITIAFPANIRQIDLLNQLAGRVRLSLLVDNPEVVRQLDAELRERVSVWIEVDSGAGRTGVPSDDTESLRMVTDAVINASSIDLKGFYTHAGHSYHARGAKEVLKVFSGTVRCMREVRQWAESIGLKPEICMGDTPGCSVGEDFEGIDSISPGNFVFYDVMQTGIGSCASSQIAVSMACPVVARRQSSREVCIYGGAVHFSKDSVSEGVVPIYGKVVKPTGTGWGEPVRDCFVKALSQEHGIVQLSEEVFEEVKVGDVLLILPVHSCLTAEAMGVYMTTKGEKMDHYAQKNRD